MKRHQILLALNILLLGFIWIFTLMNFSALPEIIPVHFDAVGRVDAMGTKNTVFILPVVATFIFLMLLGVAKNPDSPLLNVPPSYRQPEKLKNVFYGFLFPVMLLFAEITVETILIADGKLSKLSSVFFIVSGVLIIYFGVMIYRMISDGKREQKK